MDRVELGIKFDQINKLREKGEYRDAAKVCDTIDWRKIKKWSEFSAAQEVYEKVGRIRDSRNICVYAYNRGLGGKRLLFKLTELSIAINDLEEADDLYKEFVETSPHDMERYILLYKLNKARGAGNNRLIGILEEYKQNELDEQYEYELAELYADAGRVDDCIRECDDLILWFNEGEYVEKALRLKAKHAELTKSQKAKLKNMEELREPGREYESETNSRYEPDTPPVRAAEYEGCGKKNEEEYSVPEKDYSIYDTQNVQAELAKNMAAILEGIKQADNAEQKKQETAKKQLRTAEGPPAEPDLDDMEDYYGRTAEIYSNSQIPYGAAREPEDYASDTGVIIESLDTEAPDEPESPESTKPYSPNVPYDDFDDMAVDEPTKEIRINTHHWKRYKSYMVEDEASEPRNNPDEEKGLPVNFAENGEAASTAKPEGDIRASETAAESAAEEAALAAEESDTDELPPEGIADEEPAPEDAPEGKNVPEEAYEESEPEETAEEKPSPEEAAEESETEERITEEAAEIKITQVSLTGEEADAADSEIIDGQIDLLSWLSADSRSSENEEAPETEAKQEQKTDEEPEPEDILPEIEETEDETEDDKSVEEVMDEMTRMLMEEVAQDIEDREKQKKPSGVSEEEYIATAENREEEDDGEEQRAAAEAEMAVTKELEPIAEADYYDEAGGYGRLDEADNDFVLKPAERKYLRQYLFMDGLEEQVAQIINSKKKEISDGTSAKGNIVILGKSKANKKNFAIDLFKAMHAHDGAGSLKIARTTAAIINRNGIKEAAGKIKGMTLIVEHAGQLTKKSVGELCGFMKGDTESMLVMLTGEDYAVKRIFSENPDFAEMFDYIVHIRQYTVNEFVAIAKEYARVKGYLITDRALLKLYLMIDGLVAKDDGAQIDGVRHIVDNAIERSKKKPKKSGSLIRLKEKDFVE